MLQQLFVQVLAPILEERESASTYLIGPRHCNYKSYIRKNLIQINEKESLYSLLGSLFRKLQI